MTKHYPVVFETEEDGAISAYVAGLPIYAQATTEAEAQRAIANMLVLWFKEHMPTPPIPRLRVARVLTREVVRGSGEAGAAVDFLSAAALVGQKTSAKKRASSRANGRLGGRPRKVKR